MAYQVYTKREGRWTTEGCWGAECALVATKEEATSLCEQLSRIYQDCPWGFAEVDENGDVAGFVTVVAEGHEGGLR